MDATSTPPTPSTPDSMSAASRELGRAFKEAGAAVRRLRGRDTQRPGDLSYAQYSVLFELLGREEINAGELATVAGVSPASITEMLDRLAALGYVERARSEKDRRVVVCRLTDAGRERCEQRKAQLEPLWAEALEDFSEEQLLTAAAVLDALRAMFERYDTLDGR